MNANPKFLAATAHVDDAAVQPLPSSRKVHVSDLRVPMREIRVAPTHTHAGLTVENPAVTVYDTSGPYTDPDVEIDLRRGLAPLRREWILGRADVEELPSISSEFGRRRAADPDVVGSAIPESEAGSVSENATMVEPEPQPAELRRPVTRAELPAAEVALLAVLVQGDQQMLEHVFGRITPDDFAHPLTRELGWLILAHYQNGRLFLVVMGRLCPWEWLWYMARAHPITALRRVRGSAGSTRTCSGGPPCIAAPSA